MGLVGHSHVFTPVTELKAQADFKLEFFYLLFRVGQPELLFLIHKKNIQMYALQVRVNFIWLTFSGII